MKLCLSKNNPKYSYLQMYKGIEMYTDVKRMVREINIELDEFKILFEQFNPHYVNNYWRMRIVFETKDIKNVQDFLDNFNILLKLLI